MRKRIEPDSPAIRRADPAAHPHGYVALAAMALAARLARAGHRIAVCAVVADGADAYPCVATAEEVRP